MNAKEAKKLAKKSKPAADAAEKKAKLDHARWLLAQSRNMRAAKKAAFDKRYSRVEEAIERACKRAETTCDVSTQYEDREHKDAILAKLRKDGFKAELAKRGYWDQGSNSEGYPDGDRFWSEYEVIAISW